MKTTEAQVREVGKIETQLKHGGAKVDELKIAGIQKWEIFQAGAKSAWNKLAIAFTKLTN